MPDVGNVPHSPLDPFLANLWQSGFFDEHVRPESQLTTLLGLLPQAGSAQAADAELLECLVQLAARDVEVGRDVCQALHKHLMDAKPAQAVRIAGLLKEFAFGLYRSNATKAAAIPAYLLYLAGVHARDHRQEVVRDQITNGFDTQLPQAKDERWLERGREVTDDELNAIRGRKHGPFLPYAGGVAVSDGFVDMVGLDPDQVVGALWQGVPEIPPAYKPVSFWLNNHYLHGFCSWQDGKRVLTLLDSSPNEEVGRAGKIRDALKIPDLQLHIHGQALQNDMTNACGPLGERLFRFCAQRGSGQPDDIKAFAAEFAALSTSEKTAVLDGVRADLLDAWVQKPSRPSSPVPT